MSGAGGHLPVISIAGSQVLYCQDRLVEEADLSRGFAVHVDIIRLIVEKVDCRFGNRDLFCPSRRKFYVTGVSSDFC